jgi:site-specific DNA-methyltransferase (adenine-specific)
MGSGQTALAAIKTKRYYIGYEIQKDYVKLSLRRIKEFSVKSNILELFEVK